MNEITGKQNFKNEVLQWGANNIEGFLGSTVAVEDFHHNIFNTDYFVIYTHEARVLAHDYDVFDAIDEVTTYQEDNFGEVDKEALIDPEKLVNMLAYILGEEALSECETYTSANMTGEELTDEVMLKIKAELEAQIKK